MVIPYSCLRSRRLSHCLLPASVAAFLRPPPPPLHPLHPLHRYNLDALLSLGVSYVNELDSARSLKALKAWVQHNPKFQGMEVVNDGYSDG